MLLTVEDLHVTLGSTEVARGVSFEIPEGRCLGLVGVSGSGKSTTALALTRLLPSGATYSGKVLFGGRDLHALSLRELREVRGREIGFVFQDPLAALNPVLSVGDQVTEAVRAHASISYQEGRRRAIELLASVDLFDAERLYSTYPHELSGGLRQRAALAGAIAGGPKLLVADEPTSSLDVSTQARVLALFKRLKSQGMALLFISHDIATVALLADEIAVLEAGRIVEQGVPDALFSRPQSATLSSLVECHHAIDRQIGSAS